MDVPSCLHYSSLISIIVKPFSVSILVALLSMFALLIIVALVSAAESAFFSLTPTDMDELKTSDSKIDEKILLLISVPKRLLATVLISINFINIATVILSTYVMEELFDFAQNPTLGFVIQVVIVTFLILLVGEVIPKIYATQNPLRTSRILIYLVLVLKQICYPISSFLIFSTSLIDKVIKPRSHNISVDELFPCA